MKVFELYVKKGSCQREDEKKTVWITTIESEKLTFWNDIELLLFYSDFEPVN